MCRILQEKKSTLATRDDSGGSIVRLWQMSASDDESTLVLKPMGRVKSPPESETEGSAPTKWAFVKETYQWQ